MVTPARKLATVADFLAIPEEQRFHELIDGELLQKAMPSPRHGGAQAQLTGVVAPRYGRRPGGRWLGGWWLATEVEIQFTERDLYRPDVSGWRRERLEVVDPMNEILTVHRWSSEGYLTILTADRSERVRAEPFEAIEWPLGVLFGDDPDDDG